MRRALATAATLALAFTLLLAPSTQAGPPYEEVGVFAGSATPLTKEQIEANEEIQLGGVGGMAINRSGAGGVPKGTLYAAVGSNSNARIARYDPVANPGPGEPWLKLAEAWQFKSLEGAYERCGPLVKEEGKGEGCKANVGGTSDLNVAVDQTTGYVYAYNGSVQVGQNAMAVYTPDGSAVVTRFAERAPAAVTTASTPEKFHRSSPGGGMTVNEEGEVFLFDLNSDDNFYHRLMVFKPQTPGDYSKYEYAGEIAAGFIFENNYPTRPIFDDAGRLYVASEDFVERLPAQEPEPYPAAHPAPTCSFKFAKSGITAMTVDPRTGEPFFFSYKLEKGFTHKVVHQLGPCEEGKFKETAKYEVTPERDDLWAMAFDPERQLEAGRPAGVLYGAAPDAQPGIGTGEPGQSSLGYVFALPEGSTKTLTVTKTGSGTGKVTSSPSGIDCGTTCVAEFPEGSTVTLSAKADAGSEFKGWSGSGCSGTGTCLVTISEAKSVTAEFSLTAKPKFALKAKKAGSGTGTVTSSPSGINCGSDCEEEYEEGTAVTLTGTPGESTEAALWTGCDSVDGENKCLVSMSAAKEVTATFEEEEAEEPGIPLTVALEGTGSGTVTSDKGLISCNPFCSDEYEAGTKVTLTATPTPGSIFYSWKYCDAGGVNGRQCTVTLDKAKTVKATFTTTHTLEVSKAPGSGRGKVQSSPGGVLCLFNCQETSAAFREGTEVTLKATPAKHFHFVQWGGDCSGTSTCQVTMGSDHEVSAEFGEDPKHLLTLTKSGGGAGTVKSSVAGINCGAVCSSTTASYYQGELVELTATPGKGSAFTGWSGAGCSGTGTCTVTVDAGKSVTAEFK